MIFFSGVRGFYYFSPDAFIQQYFTDRRKFFFRKKAALAAVGQQLIGFVNFDLNYI